MKRIIVIFILLLSSISFGQNAADYFPNDLGHIWNYKIVPLDSLGNPIEDSAVYEIDSLVISGNFYGKDSYVQLVKIGPAASINQQQFNDSLFINLDGSVANIYFNSLLNSLSEGVFDFAGNGYSDWLPLYDFSLLPGQSAELFRLDSTITIDSVDIPSRITVESKRLQDEIIETELGQFITKKFEISFNYYYLSIIPIKLFSIPEVFWFAPDNWLVKEKRESINIDLSQFFDVPAFYLPGSRKDIVSVITGVEDSPQVISDFKLFQNYPNPFNPSTVIEYSLPIVETRQAVETRHALSVQLKIYNILGKEMAVLVNGIQSPGNYKVNFNASSLGSGIYFYKLNVSDGAENFVSTKKMLLIK